MLLAPLALRARPVQDDTTVDAQAFASAPSATVRTRPTLPTTAEEPDEEDVGQVTAEMPPREQEAPVAAFSGSSDPPTRFVRRYGDHVDLPGGSLVDDYEIEAKIGEGAMGVVYSATHTKLGRRVAIKVIAPTIGQDPQAIARFEREARTLASIHHPNIVDVYAFGTLADGRSYFAMEYMSGEALGDRLERGRLSLDEALDLVDQIARGLEAAHAQRIVHRDLKPSNIFLAYIARENRPAVKLIDFGLVKSSRVDSVENTASAAIIGTAAYIAPEQARSPNVDGRADVYALGCVAYELVLGCHPFPAARTALAAVAAHLTEPPPHPRSIWPEIPATLDLLLFSMLAKDPSYRPTLAQVRHVVASLRSRPRHESELVGAARSRAWTAAGIAIALLIGIAIGARAIGTSRGDGSQVPTFGTHATVVDAGDARTSSIAPVVAPPPDAPVVVIDAQRASSDAASVDGGEAAVVPPRALRPSSNNAPATGALSIDSRPWTDVLVDGARVGRTPVVGVRLSVGQRKVTLINAQYGIKESFRIDVRAGRSETMLKDYSERPEVRDKLNGLRK